MKEQSYSASQRQTAKENKVVEKLKSFRERLKNEVEFKTYNFSEVDDKHSQDYTVWISGFNNDARIQLKHQLKSEKVVLNLRPLANRVIEKEQFSRLMEKKGFEIKNKANQPYVPVDDFVTKHGYRGGFETENYEVIKAKILLVINGLSHK